MNDDDEPIIDLHESEWSYQGRREPFWGPNAKFFGIMTVIGLLVSYPASKIGEFVSHLILH